MPVNPTGTPLVFTDTASTSVTVYASDITRAKIIEPFTRNEFSNDRLRAVKNDLGGLPMIVTTIANTPIQISITCAGDSPRPLTPDSISNLNAINQQFITYRYTIRGISQDISVLETIANQALVHAQYLQKFQYHQTKVQSDISYNNLVALQSENFDYLQTTNVFLGGPALGGTLTNILIVSFELDVSHEVTQANGSTLRMANWSMVCDQRTITSQGI